jgi:hypothetical protein
MRWLTGLTLSIFTALTAPAAARQNGIEVTVDGRTEVVSVAGIERHTVVTADGGLRTTFEGIALRDLLEKRGVAVKGLRGKALAQVILATGRDGYQVAYAIAEVDASFTDRIILVADTRNGKPLLADTGPWQLVVPGEQRAARWIRQLTGLEVRQLP